MRGFLKWTVIVVAALLGVLVVLVATPLGLRVAGAYMADMVVGEWGLTIEYESLEGSLATGVLLRHAEMRAPEGPAIASLDSLRIVYDARRLVFGHGLDATVDLAGANVLLERRDGALLGWSAFGKDGEAGADTLSATADTTSGGGGMSFDVAFLARDATVTYVDTAAGVHAVARDLRLSGAWSAETYDAALRCSLVASAEGLDRPVEGMLEADLSGGAGSLEVSRFVVDTDALALEASGELDMSGPSSALGARATSTVRLGKVTALLAPRLSELPEIEGALRLTASAQGKLDSLSYAATASASSIDIGVTNVADLLVEVSGSRGSVEIDTLRARAFGGAVGASGALDLPAYEGRIRLAGVSVAKLAGAAPGGSEAPRAEIEGTLILSADVSGAGGTLADVYSAFSASVDGLVVEGMELGRADADGTLEAGTLLATVRCCSTTIAGRAVLDGSGLVSAEGLVEARDLRAVADAAGVEALAGKGTVSVDAERADGAIAVSARAEFPELSYMGVEPAPLSASVEGRGDSWRGWFGAFEGSLMGQARFSGGAFQASLVADGLDLVDVLPDSVRGPIDLAGTVGARFSVTGDTSGVGTARGTISRLDLSVRGEDVTLLSPFRFAASRESLSITQASLATTFGDLSVSGAIGERGGGRVTARLDSVDLAVAERMSDGGVSGRLRGTVRGSLDFYGGLESPRFALDLSADDVSYAGLGFEEIVLEAENDTSDVVFYLNARSAAAGEIMINGTAPVRPDSIVLLRFDRDREFGVSLIADELALDVERWGVRGLGGLRRVELDGSMLLTGRSDSLSNVRGRGSFDTLDVDLGLIGVSLRDILSFDLGGGRVEFAETTLDFARRRVLRGERGGSLRFGGVLRSDRTVDAVVSIDSLSVGHVVRAVADVPASPVTGRLDLDAEVGGSVTHPIVSADFALAGPALGGFAFDGLAGSVELSEGVLSLERTELSAGKSVLSAAGRVVLPTRGADAGGGELDLTIHADDFRLERVRPESPEIRRLGGGLDVDLSVSGPLDAPEVRGSAGLSEGMVEGFGLEEPITGAEFALSAEGDAVSLDRGVVPMGDGAVEVSGFAGIGSSGPPAFRLAVRLEDPELVLRDLLEARFSGSLRWSGTTERSQLEGDVSIDRLDVVYEVSFAELLTRRASRVTVALREREGPEVRLDVDVNLDEPANIESNVADLSLSGGFQVRGTSADPRLSGSVYAEEGGTLQYLDHEFDISTLTVAYLDPRRKFPNVDLVGVTTATDRAGLEYDITLRFNGFADEAVPQFSSTPHLSQPDIVALLTFGDTVGMLVSGQQPTESSGDSFQDIAQRTFISNAFGIAEATLERWLNLDTVRVDEEAIAEGNLEEADVTIGKQIGSRLSVNYTTQVGRFDEQAVEVLFSLTRRLSVGTRADPEGNHAINLRLRVPFR
ncbi:MAG: hypothetical protein GF400_03350 [Candidatus Eisenbacteria bacterium]|nr:hypothetical protein [Candidatus Eisenbacteria bacterium]